MPRLWSLIDPVKHGALLLSTCVTLGKLLHLTKPHFLICKKGIMIVTYLVVRIM